MKILSLITHFQHIDSWEQSTTRIDKVVPSWASMGRSAKAWSAARIASGFDCIIFFYDPLVCVLFLPYFIIQHFSKVKPKLVFTTWLCDVSVFREMKFNPRGSYNFLRWVFFCFFVRICDKIIVHSSYEVNLYANVFKSKPEKFAFLPYFVRNDALIKIDQQNTELKESYIIAAGRHRDFITFIKALEDSEYNGVIVCGDSDLQLLPLELPSNITLYSEIPFQKYRELIGRASAMVIPLCQDSMLRSLGQVAAFEAVAKKFR